MAVISTSHGMVLLTLDPEGWAEMMDRLELHESVKELVGSYHIETMGRRGETFDLAPWAHLEDGGRAVDEDRVIQVQLSKTEVDEGGSRLQTIGEILGRLVCTSCGDDLLKTEVAICGACEAHSALDLLALARELRVEG